MSALADDLLDDLESDDEGGSDGGRGAGAATTEAAEGAAGAGAGAGAGAAGAGAAAMDESSDESGSDGEDEDEDASTRALLAKAKERHAVGSLRASAKYQSQFGEVKRALGAGGNAPSIGEVGVLEDDPEYKLVVSCNRLAQEVDDEMDETFQLILEIYSKKFPELEGIVTNKLDYVKTVMRIGNEVDVSSIVLHDILPSAVVMIVNVSSSTTAGKQLSETDWKDCLATCNEMLRLTEDKQVVLDFVESRMQRIAPNLVHIVGSRVAAQLVGLAGGVVALSKVPACNLEVLGHDRRNLGGLSSLSSKSHFGVLVQCDLVQSCVGKLRRKAIKVVAAKVTLACRIDSYKNHNNASEGQRLRKQIQDKIDHWGEPDKARTKKALPVPDEKKKSRRGGKRARMMKERMGVTDLRAAHNKMSFSIEGGEYGDSAMGFDTGLVGIKDTGKLRAPQTKKKEMHLSKKMKKALTASSGQVNGLASSIVQTHTGGFELRPNAAAERVAAANEKWFSANAGFASVAPT